jgi:hypothetical protein
VTRQVLVDLGPVGVLARDELGHAVGEDAEVVSTQVGGADRWTGPKMASLGRRAGGGEDPPAVQEVAVDRADAWLAPRGHCRQRQHAHAGEDAHELSDGQGALAWDHDGPQVLGRSRERGVEKGLQFVELCLGLFHRRILTSGSDIRSGSTFGRLRRSDGFDGRTGSTVGRARHPAPRRARRRRRALAGDDLWTRRRSSRCRPSWRHVPYSGRS